VDLRIADPVTGEERRPAEVGEVWLRAPNVMLGYFNRPIETAAALAPDGWLRTGDGGYVDEDGYLFLTDRIKDMIVSGGENVYPVEVEEALAQHPAVDQVAVIGVGCTKFGDLFDTSYDIGSDYDFILRAMTKNFRVRYIREILIDFQLGGLSSKGLRSAFHQNIECLRARRRHIGARLDQHGDVVCRGRRRARTAWGEPAAPVLAAARWVAQLFYSLGWREPYGGGCAVAAGSPQAARARRLHTPGACRDCLA
jgi:hypothetical protein